MPLKPSESKWISAKDAANELGVHIDTIEKWAKRGLITYWQAPRAHMKLERASWERFIKSQTKEAKV